MSLNLTLPLYTSQVPSDFTIPQCLVSPKLPKEDTKSIFSSNTGIANSKVACANSTFSLALASKSFWVSSSNSVEIPPGVDEVG